MLMVVGTLAWGSHTSKSFTKMTGSSPSSRGVVCRGLVCRGVSWCGVMLCGATLRCDDVVCQSDRYLYLRGLAYNKEREIETRRGGVT